MIYELRTYELRPGMMADFLAVMGELHDHLERHGAAPLGFWSSEFGTLNEVTHLYAFEDFAERTAKTARWKADAAPEKVALQLRARDMMVRQSSKLLTPAPFSRMK